MQSNAPHLDSFGIFWKVPGTHFEAWPEVQNLQKIWIRVLSWVQFEFIDEVLAQNRKHAKRPRESP